MSPNNFAVGFVSSARNLLSFGILAVLTTSLLPNTNILNNTSNLEVNAQGSMICPDARADLWFANDESGSVSTQEFDDALDFMYQISDGFHYDATTGLQAGAFAWDTGVSDVIIPITENFGDLDDSGLKQNNNVVIDGDGQGIRELYPNRTGSGGTELDQATQYMANLINGGNGRRAGVPQIGLILTDASSGQLTGSTGGNSWINAANNLRNAGPNGTKIVVIVIEEAYDAYQANTSGTTGVVDSVAGPDGLVVPVPTYSQAADPANSYIDDVINTICQVAEVNGDVELQKSAVFNDENGDGFTQAGETITYTYDVTNTGTTDLTDITIQEDAGTFTGTGSLPIPQYVSGDEDLDGEGDAPDLSSTGGGAVVFEADYVLTTADVNTASITNSALVTADDSDGFILNDISDDPNNPAPENNNPTVLNLPFDAELMLTKTINNTSFSTPVLAGDTIDYEIIVENVGTVEITDITVNDPILGGDITNACTFPISASAGLGAGEVANCLTNYGIDQNDIDTGYVENSATASGLDPLDATVLDVSDAGDEITETEDALGTINGDPTDDPTVETLDQVPGIVLTKESEPLVDSNGDSVVGGVGDELSYSFTVENNGNITLSNITITDPNAVVSGGPITLVPMQVDSSSFTAVHTITQLDIDAGEVINSATVSGEGPQGQPASDTSDDPANLDDNDDNGDGEPDDPTNTPLSPESSVRLYKYATFNDENGDGFASAGETISYSFDVTNTGQTTLTSLEVVDPTVSVSGTIINNLAPGQTDSSSYTGAYTISSLDITAGYFENSATVDGENLLGDSVSDDSDAGDDLVETADGSGATDGDSTNDPTMVTLTPPSPAISLEKTGVFNDENADGFAQIGETITYSFSVENIGDVELTDVQITDPLITVNGGPLNVLSIGQTDIATFTGTYTLTQGDVDSENVENVATVTAVDTDGLTISDTSDDPNDSTNNDNNGDGEPDDPTITGFNSFEQIQLTKSGVTSDINGNSRLDEGDTISYSFVVENTGDQTLFDVVVTDPLVTVSHTPILTLNPGEQVTLNNAGIYTINQADIDNGFVTNTAEVTANDSQGNTVNDTSDDLLDSTDTDVNGDGEPDDPTVTIINQDSNISLLKTAIFNDEDNDTYASINETITYVFEVENTGNTTLTNITISDDLPGMVLSGGPIVQLLPGEVDNTTIYGTYTLIPNDIALGYVDNQAIAQGTAPDGIVSDESDDPANVTDEDQNGDGNPDDVTRIILTPKNETKANPDVNQTPQGQMVQGNVLTNDQDSEGNLQNVVELWGNDDQGDFRLMQVDNEFNPIYTDEDEYAGQISIANNGQYTFEPQGDFVGSIQTTYFIQDDATESAIDSSTLTINVIATNDVLNNQPPVANDDTAGTEQDTALIGTVLTNDFDPDNDDIVVTEILADIDGDGLVDDVVVVGDLTSIYGVDLLDQVVVAGDLTLLSDGTYVYTPASGFVGDVAVMYTIEDTGALSDNAILRIDVTPSSVNNTFGNDDAQTGENGEVLNGNVLDNDTDPETDTQTVNAAFDVNGVQITLGQIFILPSGSTLVINDDGSYTYSPEGVFAGTDIVVYEVCDDGTPQACDTATLYLTIQEGLVPSFEIEKTIYEGSDGGAQCGVNSEDLLILVDPDRVDKTVTYCFEITNTGDTYLGNIQIDDPALGYTQDDMTIVSGVAPLAPGDGITYYVEYTTNDSIDNDVTVTVDVTDEFGDNIPFNCNLALFDLSPSQDCMISESDSAKLVYVFDPPFGIKTGSFEGDNILRWNMVWINDSSIVAPNIVIVDEIPEETEFFGNLECTPEGVSVVDSCDYEPPSTQFPRGRVVVVGDIGPDTDALTQLDAVNEIVISFDVLVESTEPGQVYENQATLDYDADGDGSFDLRAFSEEPGSLDGMSRVVIPQTQLLRTGGEIIKDMYPYLTSGLMMVILGLLGLMNFKKLSK